MKIKNVAIITLALSSVIARAAIEADFNPILEHVDRIAFGAAAGYVAKNRINAYNSTSSSPNAYSNALSNAGIAAAAVAAAYYALGGKYNTKCFYVGSLAAITTFLITQNAQPQVDADLVSAQSAADAS